jgi:membrane protein DedA with SNARE-associated domain
MLTVSVTQAVVDWLTRVIGDFGAVGVFVLMTLESACIPIPSEVIQLFAGLLVHQHKMSLVAAIAAGTLGNVVGSVIAWMIGAYGGRPFIERHGRWLHITPKRLAQADRWFDTYGNRVVFWSRMVPIVRTFISLPAGISRMPLGRFTLYTALGALPWVTLLTLAGVKAGENWTVWHSRLELVDYLVAALLVAGGIYLWLRSRRRATEAV